MNDLKRVKLACLESSWSGGSEKSPSSVTSTTSTTTATKTMRPPTPIRRCQVDGCNLDLSGAKDYYQRYRICVKHKKSSVVIVNGLERRFSQLCSRFHCLSEFDQIKRSCRKKLSAHNARSQEENRIRCSRRAKMDDIPTWSEVFDDIPTRNEVVDDIPTSSEVFIKSQQVVYPVDDTIF